MKTKSTINLCSLGWSRLPKQADIFWKEKQKRNKNSNQLRSSKEQLTCIQKSKKLATTEKIKMLLFGEKQMKIYLCMSGYPPCSDAFQCP